ncbi:MAG: DUF669 domain-containing protein [Planctomycetota bacterium]|jgi:hypothetical protein
MTNLNSFNANEVEPLNEFEPIPAGKYLAVITNSEMKPTKAGTGNYLELTFQIIEGEYKNRNLWSRLNLENPTPKAVEIALAELSSICRAVGVMEPNDSVELHNLPLVISVKCKKRDDTGDIVNEIKGYAKRGDETAQSELAAGDSPPWKQKSA